MMVINTHNKIATVRKLPYDAEIEYLESTGTQWIDSGISAKSTYTISTTVSLSSYNSWSCLWSARNIVSSVPKYTFTLFENINHTQGRFDFGTSQIANNFNFSDWESKHTYRAESNKLYIDDTLYCTATASPEFTTGGNVWLLASESTTPSLAGQMTNFLKGKIYSAKIIDNNGNAIRDFIPVRFTNEFGQTEGAMYDKVSGELFRNQGSGSFEIGPDLIPYDAEVEYLESEGCYVDSGVACNASLSYEADLFVDGAAWILGARIGNQNNDVSIFYQADRPESPIRVSYGNARVFVTAFGRMTIKQSGKTNTVVNAGKTFVNTLNGTPTNNLHFYVVGLNNNGTVTTSDHVRYYSIRLWQSSILVRDFIPVRKGTVGYMYDRANPKGGPLGNGLYPNSGTGEFILGKDVAYPNRKFEVTFRKPNIWIKLPTYVPLWNEPSGTAGGNSALNPRGLTGVSLCGWIYIKNTATNATFFGWQSTGSWGGLSIGMWNNSYYFRGGTSSRAINNTRVGSGVWTHVGFTWSTSSFVVYLNGQVLATATNSTSSIGSNVSTTFRCIGGNAYSDNDAVNVYQKGMALYNVCGFKRALTAQEMLSIYSSGDSFKKTNLYEELWFGFDFQKIQNGIFSNMVQNGPGLTVTNPSDVEKENIIFNVS